MPTVPFLFPLFNNLNSEHPVGHAIIILTLVALTGLILGNLKIRGVGLGISGILFTGITFGHFGFAVTPAILDFTRDFGLVLFVYTVGMQVGPGFFGSLQKQGLLLNSASVVVVGLGALLTLLFAAWMKFPIAEGVGLFCGATTNTPSLGAAQEALKSLPNVGAAELALPALAYAATYPVGIFGSIFTILFLKWIFKIDPKKEAALFHLEQGLAKKPLQRLSVKVQFPRLAGMKIREIDIFADLHIVATRIQPFDQPIILTATPETMLHLGDILLVVGEPGKLEQFCSAVGMRSQVDLMKSSGPITYKDVIVTHKNVLGKAIADLRFEQIYGVTISRVNRSGLEITATPDFILHFGDRIRVVGDAEDIQQVTTLLGNAKDALNHTPFLPVFVGIALGVLVGSIPITLPGLPAPISLGLAGGPIVVAIVLSRLRRFGPLVWYMPIGANLALRELGIILFLACVGLKAGPQFIDIILHGHGLLWMACAVVVTLIPRLVIGILGRVVFQKNFMTICGVLSGTMTDPPALAFATNLSGSDAPAVAYATVYPLTMLLRILVAQLLVLLFH